MANHTTGAQRYNARMDKIFEKAKTEKAKTARIQHAVTGFQIPMMSIVSLNARLETAIGNGATDDQLRLVVAEFLAG
jgi:hypothetical protein